MMANPYFVPASIKKESKRKTHTKFLNPFIPTWSDSSQMSQNVVQSTIHWTHVACVEIGAIDLSRDSDLTDRPCGIDQIDRT